MWLFGFFFLTEFEAFISRFVFSDFTQLRAVTHEPLWQNKIPVPQHQTCGMDIKDVVLCLGPDP
jgi:hypothetical protein